jgi:hypothetical protein
MKNYLLYFFLLIFISININAQLSKTILPNDAKFIGSATKSATYTSIQLGKVVPVSADLTWRPLLINRCITHHSKLPDEQLKAIKEAKLSLKINSSLKTDGAENSSANSAYTPVVGRNFAGNTNTGSTPLDNSIAISNNDNIVSVCNTSIEFYNSSGTRTFTNSIETFFNDVSISNVCDPVVIYDGGADKFIFFAQECSGNSSNTNLLVCFSVSNDPNAGWWRYKLTGDPASTNTWFDYPKMAVSNNELYITGNSFSNSGTFQEALLYQIEKNNGYTGGTFNWQYWRNISGAPFTLLPVSIGQQANYGPGIYLVATEASGGNSFKFYDLTNDMSAADEALNGFNISTTAYSPATDAQQLGTSILLDNGDCRALSGFYLNGYIHFVFHSDLGSGYNGINYNRFDLSTQTNTSTLFGQNGFDYSYPAVASFSSSATDKSVMIGFGRSGPSIYPEVRVVSCDAGFNWGPSTLVKSGNGYSALLGGSVERWGDYTGISRKHNATQPTVWMNGMFGTGVNNWDTWIGEITATGSSATGVNDLKNNTNIQVSPNPIYNEFKTEFDLTEKLNISIRIIDAQGKIVKELYNGIAQSGKNTFLFNKANLEAGSYILSITSNNQTIKNEQIIISN